MSEIKLKRIELELATDFTKVGLRKGKDIPYEKAWRVWCNGSIIGFIEKRQEGIFPYYTFRLLIHFIEDTLDYANNRYVGRDRKVEKPKKYDSLGDAAKALKVSMTEQLKHLIK